MELYAAGDDPITVSCVGKWPGQNFTATLSPDMPMLVTTEVGITVLRTFPGVVSATGHIEDPGDPETPATNTVGTAVVGTSVVG